MVTKETITENQNIFLNKGGVFINEFIVLMIPLAGTTAGAAMVFLLKNSISEHIEKALLGFASGVMIAASVWSLLIPSIEMSKDSTVAAWIPAAVGFLLGIVFLLAMDSLIPHLHLDSSKPEGLPSKLSQNTMMLLAVTLHNIPEGMAVGVAFAGVASKTSLSATAALALSLGIAIQNFPEGAIISMPLFGSGMNKGKAFLSGLISGIVEPAAGFFTIIFVSHMIPILPYLLSFAAGAMMYVVIEELIPESQSGEHSNIGTIGAAIGFVLMMILDVALG